MSARKIAGDVGLEPEEAARLAEFETKFKGLGLGEVDAEVAKVIDEAMGRGGRLAGALALLAEEVRDERLVAAMTPAQREAHAREHWGGAQGIEDSGAFEVDAAGEAEVERLLKKALEPAPPPKKPEEQLAEALRYHPGDEEGGS